MSPASRFLPVTALGLAVLAMAGPWGSSASTGEGVVPLLQALGFSPEAAAALHSAGRTVGHLTAYALFAVLALRAVRGAGPATAPRLLAAFLLSLALSCADEGLQGVARGRGSRLADVGIDAAGAVLGLLWVATRPVPRPAG